MNRLLVVFGMLVVWTLLTSAIGCEGQKEATPQKMEEFRQQHIKNAERERNEGK